MISLEKKRKTLNWFQILVGQESTTNSNVDEEKKGKILHVQRNQTSHSDDILHTMRQSREGAYRISSQFIMANIAL